MRRTSVIVLTLVLALGVAACGGDDDDDATSDTTEADTDDTAADGAADETTTSAAATDDTGEAGTEQAATLAIGETSLGDTLVDENGMTLYMFATDTPDSGTSACVDACATAWPPLTVEGEPILGDGIDAADVTTFARADGTTQVAFQGQPLYRFGGDTATGDTNGQGVAGLWFVMGPGGQIGGDV